MSDLTFLDETDVQQLGPTQLLSRMLSTKAYMSTNPSQAAQDGLPHLQAARELGAGMCGTVYAVTGTGWAIKMPKPGKTDELFEDFCAHKRIQEAFDKLPFAARPTINIPRVAEWIHPTNDRFWSSYLSYLPKDTPRNYGLLSARIPPLPEPVRAALWTQFAPPKVRGGLAAQHALSEPRNTDCLVRLYLGRREERPTAPNPHFKLRNFKLSVNEMEYLRLDTNMYAETMVTTLAFLHWEVGVDANDVEFVFGSAPVVRPTATADEYYKMGPDGSRFIGQRLDFTRRSVGLWLLDFNQCRRFPKSPEGLKQIVDGFRWNDPYYPRPGSKNGKDKLLWEYFEHVYLQASAHFGAPQGMDESFIKEVKSLGGKQVDSLF